MTPTTPPAKFKRKRSNDLLVGEGVLLDKELRDALKKKAKRVKLSYNCLCRVLLHQALDMDLSDAKLRELAKSDIHKPGYHSKWVKLKPAPHIPK